MKRPQLVSQGTLDRILNAAELARNTRDFQQSIELLERANRLDPANVNILLNLGHAHGLHFKYDLAQKCFERAIRLSGNKASVLAAAGLRAHGFGNFAMAEHYYDLARQQADVPPEALVRLAEINERMSCLEKADELAGEALKKQPGFPDALLLRARLLRQRRQFEQAETILTNFPDSADCNTRARALYELGGIFDRQERYDEAMTAFLRVKALLKPFASRMIQERHILRERLRQLRGSVTPGILRQWQSEGEKLEPKVPLVVLCGHPRSGTTLLEQVLDAHPKVTSAEETDIFHNEAYLFLRRGNSDEIPMISPLASASTEMLRKSRRNYVSAVEAFTGQTLNGRLLIDKNPSLTYLIPAIARIFPEARFLVALRDPRDVCLSCFMQPFAPVAQTSSAYLTLEDTVNEYVELMTMYKEMAAMMVNPCLEVRYEDLVNDLETKAKDSLRFLQLDWDESVLKFDAHARQKIVRSPTYADVKQPVFKRAVGRWQHYEKYLGSHLPKLIPFLKAFGYE
jgi:tetratricopeptide (TPR) repeat protein